MDHLKRGLIVLPLCWALTTALPADEMSVLDRSVGTTIELAAGDQSVAMTVGLAVRAVFQAAPLPAQNGNGNGNGIKCRFCEELETHCLSVTSNPGEFEPDAVTYCQANPDSVPTFHSFPEPDEPCDLSLASFGGEGDCRACGGTSLCHHRWDIGECHLPCSGGGGDPDVLLAVTESLRTGDVMSLALLVRESPHVRYLPLAAAVEVDSSCLYGSTGGVERMPLRPELQPRLAAVLDDDAGD